MNCVNCIDKIKYNCFECDTAYCDTCSKENMYKLKDKHVCDNCWNDVKQLEDRFHKILIDGFEDIPPDQYDSSAVECYYDDLHNTLTEIRKLFTKKRRIHTKYYSH
jgi:hypothetical protein